MSLVRTGYRGGGAFRCRKVSVSVQRPAKVKVLIVDDHPIFREGLRQTLEARHIRVVAALPDGRELLAALEAGPLPDVALMDIELPGGDGIALTRMIRTEHPAIRVIMLTAFSDPERIFAAMKAGAVGYLIKNARADQIIEAIGRVANGEAILPPEVASRFLEEFQRDRGEERRREAVAGLTPREEEILTLLATGDSNREIAKGLFISEQTVKSHVANIFRKLEINDRTQAAVLAVRLGLERRDPRS